MKQKSTTEIAKTTTESSKSWVGICRSPSRVHMVGVLFMVVFCVSVLRKESLSLSSFQFSSSLSLSSSSYGSRSLRHEVVPRYDDKNIAQDQNRLLISDDALAQNDDKDQSDDKEEEEKEEKEDDVASKRGEEVSTSRDHFEKQEQQQQQESQDWIDQWLVEGTRGNPARIHFAHVGKTGGTSLEVSILLQKTVKRQALSCFTQEMRTRRNNQSSNRKNTPSKVAPQNATTILDDLYWKCFNQSMTEHDRHLASKDVTLTTFGTHLGRHVWMHQHTDEALPAFSRQIEERYFVGEVTNTFLFSVRNPLSRVISAFNYHKNHLLFEAKKATKLQEQHQKRPPHHRSTHYPPRPMDAKFLLECFQNMNDVAQSLQDERRQLSMRSQQQHQQQEFSSQKTIKEDDSVSSSSLTCPELARRILQNQWSTTPQLGNPLQSVLQHFYHSYQYYFDDTVAHRPDVPIVVIRMEHLWDDVRRLNMALLLKDHDMTQDEKYRELQFLSKLAMHVTHGSENYGNHSSSSLSSSTTTNSSRTGTSTSKQIATVEGRRALCCEIHKDLDIYQTLIVRAVNLHVTEKYKTLQQMLQECGVTTKDEIQFGMMMDPTITNNNNNKTTTRIPPHIQRQQQELLQKQFSWSLWYNRTCAF